MTTETKSPSPSIVLEERVDLTSHFCLDCRRQWYGDNCPCKEKNCPFAKVQA